MDHTSKNQRRRSIRLREYDYAKPGSYFVTICAYRKACLFGKIENDAMMLNRWGQIVKERWESIPVHFSHIELDEFVIMPNHVHGIITIVDIVDVVRAQRAAPLRRHDNVQAGSLGAIIRSFKSVVSKEINAAHDSIEKPIWQRNYYEHIIRNAEDLSRLREYIRNNPLKWALDRENPSNIS